METVLEVGIEAEVCVVAGRNATGVEADCVAVVVKNGACAERGAGELDIATIFLLQPGTGGGALRCDRRDQK